MDFTLKGSSFLSVTWLSHGQGWATVKVTASLTGCKSQRLYSTLTEDHCEPHNEFAS